MTIKMTKVTSTSISEIGYKRRTMHVQFNGGKTYEYKKVPRAMFDALSKASSKGQFFIDNIKDAFNYRLIA